MWENMVDPDRSQMTIWRKCIACWITKATNTHLEYVILIAFPLQQWLHEGAWILRSTCIAYPVILSPLLSSCTFNLGNISSSHSFYIFFLFHYFFYSFFCEFPSSSYSYSFFFFHYFFYSFFCKFPSSSSSFSTSFTPFSANFLLLPLLLLLLLHMFYSIMIPVQNLPSVSSSSSFFLKFLLSSFTFLFFITFFPPHIVCCILLCLNPFKAYRFLYVPPGLKLKNSTWCSLCFECFLRISEETATFASYTINWLVFITAVESVYSAVRSDFLHKADYVSSFKV